MDPICLVVCPDQDAANLLAIILSEIGMAAEHTTSISRGLELLDSQHFDAMVFDYRADASSDEFMAHLRQSTKYRPSLLIAVVDGSFNARPVFGLGANFVLYRPLSFERTRISLRAARGLMRRERRRSSRMPINAPVTIACPGRPETECLFGRPQRRRHFGPHRQGSPRLQGLFRVHAVRPPATGSLVGRGGLAGRRAVAPEFGFLDVPQSSHRIIQAWLQRNDAPTPSGDGRPAARRQLRPRPRLTSDVSHRARASRAKRRHAHLQRRKPPRRATFRLQSGSGGLPSRNRRPQSLHPDRYQRGRLLRRNSRLHSPAHSGVEILLRTADTKLVIRGQVLTTHPGFGMGVRFDVPRFREREEVLRLLASSIRQLVAGRTAPLKTRDSCATPNGASNSKHLRAFAKAMP